MKLVTVNGNPDAAPFLFELLAERPRYAWISHGEMPSRSAHEEFVANHPFRHWYLIDNAGTYVGAIECTDRNEIGVHILQRYQKKGYAHMALAKFLATHTALPPVKAVRNGKWLANIACGNEAAKDFFHRMGFVPVQETWSKG